MSEQEFKALGQKVVDGTATQLEKLSFLQELNASVTGARELLKDFAV